MKENEKIDKYLELAKKLLKKNVEYEDDSATSYSWSTWNGNQRFGKIQEQKIRDRIGTILTTALRSVKILRRVLDTRRDSVSLRL